MTTHDGRLHAGRRYCDNAAMAFTPPKPLRPALFLDRDGVINVNHGYVHRAEDTQLVPGIVGLCLRARALGYALVVVTNQAGIARGYYSEDDYHAYSAWLRGHLASHGVLLDGIYHCPHHPDAGTGPWRRDCACRKPGPGMILTAARDLALDLPRSILLGDTPSDIEAGRRAGVGRLWMLVSDPATVLVPEGAYPLQHLAAAAAALA